MSEGLKALMVVFDGMADRPVPELGDRTPLEAARKPHMDELARRGICGLMDTISPGVPPGSDTAHLALLGYDPFEVYTGRGSFEAAGAGIELKAGDIALRANYATVDRRLVVRDRRAGRIRETWELEEAIQRIRLKGVKFLFKGTSAHRAALVLRGDGLRGDGLSHELSDNDPHEVGVKVPNVKALDRRADKTAKLLNEFLRKAHRVLDAHPVNKRRIREGLPPANYLLLRGAGVVPRLAPLEAKLGLRGACVAAAALVKGVCKLAGMETIDVPGSTTGVDTDLEAEVRAVQRALERFEFVLYSIKGFDEVSHDGDFRAKIEFIERVDTALKELVDRVDYLMLTVDHTTPVSVRDHTGDPVPIAIAGRGVRADDVETYDERACARGGLGHVRGKDLLPILANLMGKAKKFGA